MDATQIILAGAVLVLTVLLTLVGIEVFLIFKEFHRTVKKLNQILDDIGLISGSVSKQITNVSELLATIKTTFDLAKIFFKRERKEEIEDENLSLSEGSGDGNIQSEEGIMPSVRRFFTRAGKRLS